MVYRKMMFWSAVLWVVVSGSAGRSFAGQNEGPPLRVRWISAGDVVVPGRPFDMAFQFEMQPGWHTYWVNPGDGGIPLTVEWTLPAGLEVLPLEWPVPEVFVDAGIVSYGFEETVTVPFRVQWNEAWRGGTSLRLEARLEWMACLEFCVGGEEHLTWEAPVGEELVLGAKAPIIAEARARLPVQDPAWNFTAVAANGQLQFFVQRSTEGRSEPVSEGRFFASRQSVIRPSAVARWRETESDRPYILLQRDPFGPSSLERLEGVFVPAAGRAVRVDVPVTSHRPAEEQEKP